MEFHVRRHCSALSEETPSLPALAREEQQLAVREQQVEEELLPESSAGVLMVGLEL
jgi:hypothetical protein